MVGSYGWFFREEEAEEEYIERAARRQVVLERRVRKIEGRARELRVNDSFGE